TTCAPPSRCSTTSPRISRRAAPSGRSGRTNAAGRGAGIPITHAHTRGRLRMRRCSCSAPAIAGKPLRARISRSPCAASATTARRAADWMLTFRYTYDVDFPEDTPLGRYGFKTRGADVASPPNQHLHAFGLICLPELMRLGEPYRTSALQNLDCFRQFIARD